MCYANPMKSHLYFAIGCIFFALGVIGAFLPVMPTTPFLLVAAFCWARSSKKFHHWLVTHPIFGPPIQDWNERGAIRLPIKITATILMVVTPTVTLLIDGIPDWAKLTYVGVIAAVLIFIWTRPH